MSGSSGKNVLAKVPKNAQREVKADYWAIFDVPENIEPGLDAVAKRRSASTRSKSIGATRIRLRCGACSPPATR